MDRVSALETVAISNWRFQIGDFKLAISNWRLWCRRLQACKMDVLELRIPQRHVARMIPFELA